MLYEIDFLPVGNGEKSGDAISLRYSSDGGSTWTVGVIDGGTQESGEALCEHIPKFYGTEQVDFVICTHPEQDHASGLSCVLDRLSVSQVLMHRPWEHVDEIYSSVTDGRVSKESLRNRLIEGHPYAYAVEEKAVSQDIPIIEPFTEARHGIPNLTIVGPRRDYYLSCLTYFRSITEVTEEVERGILQTMREAAVSAARWVAESWDDEKLVEPADDAVSSENNSGVVSLFTFGEKKALFTADVGVPGLNESIANAPFLGVTLRDFSFFQAPHHGSKRNVGPSLLDSLLGTMRAQGSHSEYTAFISASKEGEPKHPSKRVVNALIRRGAKVIATQGATKHHLSSGMPDRGWQTATPLPFFDSVEED
jgi:beta-lactamase superfamily II metal-dependent hydrolase